MGKLTLNKYSVINSELKNQIKFYWHLKSDGPVDINHTLIPTDNIDLIINFSAPITYSFDENTKIESSEIHFCCQTNSPRKIYQKGEIDVLGISFLPTGFYPLLKDEIKEKESNCSFVKSVSSYFSNDFKELFLNCENISQKILLIEQCFLSNPISPLESKINSVLHFMNYSNENDKINISRYCKENGISQKTLERNCKNITGMNPKSLIRVSRFQQVSNLICQNSISSFSQLSYLYNYFDQTHFIKDFKLFSGVTPSVFKRSDDFIKNLLIQE